MRTILLTMEALISLAVSTLTAVSQSKPETLRFPDRDGSQDWWYTNETTDGSLMLSTRSNDPSQVPFYMICKLGYTDEKRHIQYSILFQPPVPPVKDSSGTLVYRYKISHIWDPPNQADEISVPVHDNYADRVEVPGDSIAWLLYGESCAPTARRNCTGSFIIEYQSPDAGAEPRAETYIKKKGGSVTTKHECNPRDEKPCVDCTFLDYQTCYEQADKFGLINKKIGYGLSLDGWRPPLYSDRKEEPLEWECDRVGPDRGLNTKSYVDPNKGTIICPVPGAVVVDPPQKRWAKSYYSPPPLSAARLFLDRCGNLGIPSREPPPPPPPARPRSQP
jgi:hypothetical protein